MATPTTIDEYIAGYPVEVRSILERTRALIRRAEPNLVEQVIDGVPAMVLENGQTIHLAAWKRHAGVYPVRKAPSALEREIDRYRSDDDSVRFVSSKPVPWELVEELVAFLVKPQPAASPER